ncbi:unnamed protein product [Candidula unifasciata]|uniref:Uncharacterized protein n=1 Tax=Candidula unifasciata TaxID=100452 RepID=A0A8S3Z0F9_9EUPU|nr:unnamed protein product [Candidula unifasciata]
MHTRNWIIVVLIFIIFTTLVQIGGLVSPLWIYIETNNNITVGVGLYYRIGCEASSGNNCSAAGFPRLPFGYNTTATYDQMSWKAIVGLETASGGLGIVLTIMMIIYLIGFGVWKKMNGLNIAMVVICILAWLSLIAGLVVYIVFYGLVIVRSPDVNARSFPWSPLICLVAAILFFIITFLIRLRCRNRNYLKNAIPTSTDSKLALNPFTKNKLMMRYFTPSPYKEERRQALYAANSHYSDQSHLLGNGFTVGAIEQSTGVENMGFRNNYSRAIEYNVNNRMNGAAVPVIQTSTLPVGTFVGSTKTVVEGGMSGNIYDRDLSSFVNNNNKGTYGTEVVKRTLVTRTVGENSYGAEEDQRRNIAYQPEVKGVNTNTVYTHHHHQQQQQQTSASQIPDRRIVQDENIVGNSVTLNRNRGYDAFSDIDTETVYYTGKEGFRPITLGREMYVKNKGRPIATSSGVTTSYVVSSSLQPVKEEQTIEEVTVIERGAGRVAQQHSNFRVPADHRVTTGLQKAADYTVHTRTFTDNQAADQVVHTAGNLSGKTFAYNGTYIYRPYSESSY